MLKFLVKGVIFLIVLLLLALVGAHFYVKKYLNSAAFQTQVVTQIEKATNRKAKFGRADYQLIPFSLLLQNVQIQNKENTAPFIALKELSIVTQLGALLSKRIEVEKIILDSPEINVKRFADGSFDFSDMQGTPPSATPEEPKHEEPKKLEETQATSESKITETKIESPKTLPIDFNIALIHIKNAKMTYLEVLQDGTEKSFQVPALDLMVKNISLDQQIELQIKTTIGTKTSVAVDLGVGPLLSIIPNIANLECMLRGSIEIGDFKDLELFIPQELLKTLPLQSLNLSWDGKGALSQGFDFKVHLLTPKISEENKLHIDLATGLHVHIPEPVLQQILSHSTFTGRFDSAERTSLNEDIQKQIACTLDGEILVETLLVPEQLLSLSCQKFGVNIQEDKVTIQNFTFQHKDTKLILNGSVTGLNPETSSPNILLETTAEKIVLDQLLQAFPKAAPVAPAASPTPSAPAANSEPAASSEPVSELDLRSIPFLDKIHFESKTKIDQCLYQQNILQDLNVNIVLHQGILKLSPMSFKAYGGTVVDTAELRLLDFPVVYTMNFKMENIQIQEALKANQIEDETYGTLMLALDAEGQGLTLPNLKTKLSSRGEFSIRNGKRISTDGTILDRIYLALDNPILLNLLPELATKIKQAKAAQGTKKETTIEDCVVAFNLTQGTATLTQCKVGTPDYLFHAEGKAYPFDDNLDLKARFNFSEKATLELTGQKDLSDRLPYENKGLIVPLILTGPMSKPKVTPDLKDILKKVAGGQVQKALQDLLGANKEEGVGVETETKKSGLSGLLGEDGKKKLSGLLGNL
jgi:AsmA protein